MAIVVIGGVITSTFPSLLMILMRFTDVDDLLQFGGRLFRRRSAASTPLAEGDRVG